MLWRGVQKWIKTSAFFYSRCFANIDSKPKDTHVQNNHIWKAGVLIIHRWVLIDVGKIL